MMRGGINLRWQALFVVALTVCVLSEARAAFNGFMPLAYSGQVAYRYGYAENAGSQLEATSLQIGWNASGYIWRPWFATTSMALNVGLTQAESTTTSSEGTTGAGSISLGIFPRSRFPFSISYSQSDSRSQQFQDVSQVAGDSSFRTSRLVMRQSFRPRAYNQQYNFRYNLTTSEGNGFNSESEIYGMDYQMRMNYQSFTFTANHSGTKTSTSTTEPTTDVVTLSHVYTPSAELGVNSLFAYVELGGGGIASTSTDTQAFSTFYWRPEHRAINVSGGVRLSENKFDGAVSTVSRSLNTNLGMGYRITRAFNLNVSASVGTTDSGAAQSLTTTQTLSLIYIGTQRQWDGYSYSWNWSGAAANSTNRTETAQGTFSSDRQNVNTGIGHNLGKSWTASRSSSISTTLSQSASAAHSFATDVTASTINHAASLSMNSRSGRGSSYISARISDSRGFGEQNSVFNNLSLSYSANTAFSRLSNMSGNINFNVSRSETMDAMDELLTTTTKNLVGGMTYSHFRPFGVYNLNFDTNLQGTTQIDTETPLTVLRSESIFRYHLGLLSTSLSFRLSQSPGGFVTKSVNFQATRSF